MEYALIGIALILLAGIACLWPYYSLERTAKKSLPLLKTDPAAFTDLWENKYKRIRTGRKNAALLLVALGLYHQGLYERSLERARFVNLKDPFLDYKTANALYHALLLKTGLESEGAAFFLENAASIEQGRKTPWMK